MRIQSNIGIKKKTKNKNNLLSETSPGSEVAMDADHSCIGLQFKHIQKLLGKKKEKKKVDVFSTVVLQF